MQSKSEASTCPKEHVHLLTHSQRMSLKIASWHAR